MKEPFSIESQPLITIILWKTITALLQFPSVTTRRWESVRVRRLLATRVTLVNAQLRPEVRVDPNYASFLMVQTVIKSMILKWMLEQAVNSYKFNPSRQRICGNIIKRLSWAQVTKAQPNRVYNFNKWRTRWAIRYFCHLETIKNRLKGKLCQVNTASYSKLHLLASPRPRWMTVAMLSWD